MQLSRDMDFLKGLIETGHYTSVMDGAYALKDMTEAQRYIEGGTQEGKRINYRCRVKLGKMMCNACFRSNGEFLQFLKFLK